MKRFIGHRATTGYRLPDRFIAWTIGVVWIYQGLVPKIIMQHEDEQYIARLLGVPADWLQCFVYAAGAAEMVWGMIFIAAYRFNITVWLNIAAIGALFIMVACAAPYYLTSAFNGVTFNLCLLLLTLQLWHPTRPHTGQ
ncbi:DoxX-like family protein [Salinimonas sediminis]|uniref:DoxX family protein n=1 Tax=Salinimonas sediminis TaxID=2303538 RepID=A0A346NLX5_9ALTE|nr:DoxX-like family protein [Salinimonas sediminis]AXR06532.1 hypothetical protein D0Y50_09240 [Salinimonas sediminis]